MGNYFNNTTRVLRSRVGNFTETRYTPLATGRAPMSTPFQATEYVPGTAWRFSDSQTRRPFAENN